MRNIILDCDPGHDDAIAIMLAGKSKVINLLGITIVAGNQTLEKTVKNGLQVCQELGIQVNVYAGAPEPLVREKQRIADEIHGESGLDGPVFARLERKVEEKHAVIYMIETILSSEIPVTLVATGPLTNVALALKLNPAIKDNIDEIVIMGGTYQLGNLTPAAEFNILADAEAASIVFNSNVPVTMVGLDVTRKALVLPEVVDRMSKINNKAARLFCDLMKFFNKTQKEVFGWEGGPLHDPLTIAYIIDQTVLEVKAMNVQVDTQSVQSYGRTNCDYFGLSKERKNAKVAIDVDVEKYWAIIEAGILNYEES